MTNRTIANLIMSLQANRAQWITALSDNPQSITIPENILAINHKIVLLETFWNWSDTSVDFPR